MNEAIGYIRVSTQEQGRSGLGLEAQEASIRKFCEIEGLTIVDWFRDVQSGAGTESDNFRPGLSSALASAKAKKCPVVVAKLDRLSRSVHYISKLINDEVSFLVCDLGRQNGPMVTYMFAILSEQERTFISERTRAALAAKRARGEPLGNPNLAAVRMLAHQRNRDKANEFALRILPTIRAYKGQGFSNRKIAAEMNLLGVATQRKGRWSATHIARLLDRQEQLASVCQSATINVSAQSYR
jgi:DNA invertase Pin-like site-specific DNA recombinase